jgi:DNA ligase-1
MPKRLPNLPVTRHTPSRATRLRMLPLALMLTGLFAAAPMLSMAGQAPPLMLPKVYQPGVSLSDYWASEKYDGVRGYWDGEKLLTRGGERIAAPA